MTDCNIKNNPLQISLLLKEIDDDILLSFGAVDTYITSIEYNSKRVKHGSLFVAIEGLVSDGHDHVRDAVKSGAKAVLVSSEKLYEFSDLKENDVVLFASNNTRKSLSRLSAFFYRYPSIEIPVVGVTGTNGKTSITYMLESILSNNGYSPGVIGTINYRWMGKEREAPNTTPESKEIHELMRSMISDGVDIILMEVSSHGLQLSRVDDVEFDVVIFTNLTRDHLDFHESYEDYFNSKKMIFQILEKSKKGKKAGIVNIDDDYGKRIYNDRNIYSYPILSFGMYNKADYRAEESSIRNSINGLSYRLKDLTQENEINLKLAGRFHVYNSLCSFAVAHCFGIPIKDIISGLSDLDAIPGRFDRVRSENGYHVIVDYAHTEDALLRLLHSVHELNPKRLITLFGCGGNRDRSKRAGMGRIASENSDWVIVTSDNPRDENPLDIIKNIVEGIDSSNFDIIPDREEAIKTAINLAEKDDIVVIAGKGHEDYQIIGSKKIHFDDREIVKRYVTVRQL